MYGSRTQQLKNVAVRSTYEISDLSSFIIYSLPLVCQVCFPAKLTFPPKTLHEEGEQLNLVCALLLLSS